MMTCLANWNKQDQKLVVPAAMETGVGLYGFTKPNENSLLTPIEKYLSSAVDSFNGDDLNIATLARVYNGWPSDYILEKR